MDVEAFRGSAAGVLVPVAGIDPRTGWEYRHHAFLPDPLPRDVPTIHAGTWRVVSEASLALGRLDAAGRRVPNPSLLIRPTVRREAVSTSALEGTYAPFEAVLEADIAGARAEVSPAVRAVMNYVRVAELAFELIAERPISVAMLCELQSLLVSGTPSATSEAGRVRTIQVVIGPPGTRVEDARYVPPPPGDQLHAALADLETWLEVHDLDPVVAVALAHYQFEALHPFTDGNGRIGRLLVVLHLLRRGVLGHGLLTISPWLEQRRPEYQDHLLRVSQTGNFDPWIRFLAEGLRDAANASLRRVEWLLEVADRMRGLVRSRRLRGVAASIAEDLIGRPVLTPMAAARLYGVSYPAANSALARLVDAGVLREATGRSYARVFVAPEVLEVLRD